MADPVRLPFDYTIAIPASFVSDIPHMREKTFRIGMIGRAAAMFRVNEIAIYPDMPDKDQRAATKLVYTVLSYMETPQYLRRRLFKIIPELQYAGTLPPLRTPHHPVANKTSDLRLDEFREGVVVSASEGGAFIDIGVEQPALLPEIKLKTDRRVTVRVSALGRALKVALADPRDTNTYWGYKVTISNVPFCQLVKNGRFDLVVATSRKGRQIKDVMADLANRFKTCKRVLTAFGAPSQGLHEIVAHEHKNIENVADFVVNMIPNQATETVRTEEAVYASLSILNTLANGA